MWYIPIYGFILIVVASIALIYPSLKNAKKKNDEQDEKVKCAQKYYENKIECWEQENKIRAKDVYELYRSQIDWNLQMQLTWVAVFFASIVGLFELIPSENSGNFGIFHFIISLVLIGGIDFSFNQVTSLIQIILRNEMIMNASLRKDDKVISKNYEEWSFAQKNLLKVDGCQPTLKKTLIMSFRVFFIWLGSVLFILERLGVDFLFFIR